ncbi:MAG: FAD:protein FMN transferase [Kiritimatiellae bacterium]|nr:FAD:protein FMN transferase [Kiritimatiellia bacterium]
MVFLLWMACAAVAGGGEPVAFEWNAMGTRVRLLVRGEDAEEAGGAMRDAARTALEAVEAETSAFRADSAVARVSAAAGNDEWIETGAAFDEALGLALDVAEASGGAFNPLVATLMEANGFARRPEGTPSGEVFRESFLDTAKIERRPGACRLAEAGMGLDLGGVAKGVGADWATAAAGKAAGNDFLLDVGGTLVGRGGWTVGVRDPRGGADAPPLKVFTLADGMAVATSGNYERQAGRGDGTRVGHLFDPRTGLPAAGGVLQATAIAPTAAEADAWSTALFVLGPEAGRAALEGRGKPVVLWVVESGAEEIRMVGFPERAGEMEKRRWTEDGGGG